MKVEIWSDVVCPWCFIGSCRLERALADYPNRADVEITWRSYQLDPGLAKRYDGSERGYLVARKRMMPEQVDAVLSHVTRLGADEGLSFDFERVIVANSRAAHRLLHVVGGLDRAAAGVLVRAVMSAHFERGLNIGDEDVLIRLAGEVGVDAETVRAGLVDPQVDAAVSADIATAAEYGIGGVPFFVFNDRLAVDGAQPVEVFGKALRQAEQLPAADPG
jgi:predicted DsbA family dithiol-disulfide isomerase